MHRGQRLFARALQAKLLVPVALAGSCAAVAGGAFAASAAPRPSGIAPLLRREFRVFDRRVRSTSTQPAAIARSVAPRDPAAQIMIENMMQANDPSSQYSLDFSAADLVETHQGPAVLVPGAHGACVLFEVPDSFSGQPGASAACNSTANIARSGGLTATYREPSRGISIVYGMASNGIVSADLLDKRRVVAICRIHANAFAISTVHGDRVLLRDQSGRIARDIPVLKPPHIRLHLKTAARH